MQSIERTTASRSVFCERIGKQQCRSRHGVNFLLQFSAPRYSPEHGPGHMPPRLRHWSPPFKLEFPALWTQLFADYCFIRDAQKSGIWSVVQSFQHQAIRPRGRELGARNEAAIRGHKLQYCKPYVIGKRQCSTVTMAIILPHLWPRYAELRDNAIEYSCPASLLPAKYRRTHGDCSLACKQGFRVTSGCAALWGWRHLCSSTTRVAARHSHQVQGDRN